MSSRVHTLAASARHLAHRLLRPLSVVAYAARVLRGLRGVHPRTCPCCDYEGFFLAAGTSPRFDAQCPKCCALERHRLFVLACESLGLLTAKKEILHFAAEPAIRAFVAPRAARYVTADITGVGVDRAESIEATSFPAASFDMVIASHIFEHVDDRKALPEMKRIIRPSGVLVCMVPIIEGWDCTYENPTIVAPSDRQLHFGQGDHVRYYGRDFRDRLRAAGFSLQEYTANGAPAVRYGLFRGEKVFIASMTPPCQPLGDGSVR